MTNYEDQINQYLASQLSGQAGPVMDQSDYLHNLQMLKNLIGIYQQRKRQGEAQQTSSQAATGANTSYVPSENPALAKLKAAFGVDPGVVAAYGLQRMQNGGNYDPINKPTLPKGVVDQDKKARIEKGFKKLFSLADQYYSGNKAERIPGSLPPPYMTEKSREYNAKVTKIKLLEQLLKLMKHCGVPEQARNAILTFFPEGIDEKTFNLIANRLNPANKKRLNSPQTGAGPAPATNLPQANQVIPATGAAIKPLANNAAPENQAIPETALLINTEIPGI